MINKILPIHKEFSFEETIFRVNCKVSGEVNVTEAKEINLKFKGLDFVDFSVAVKGNYHFEVTPKVPFIPNVLQRELKLVEGYAKVVARDVDGNMKEVVITVTKIEEGTGSQMLDDKIEKSLSIALTKAANDYLKK